jgi:hypothetical protein
MAEPLLNRALDLASQAKHPNLDPRVIAEQLYEKLEQAKLVVPPNSPYKTTQQLIRDIENRPVFEKISNRLTHFTPPILLDKHIISDDKAIEHIVDEKGGVHRVRRFYPVVAHRNTLDGIDFIVADRQKLITDIRNPRVDGKQVFAEGTGTDWSKHWALALSFGATEGLGFREIFRPYVNDRPLLGPGAVPFDNRLGQDITVDISALHFAVANFPKINQIRCNAHIDNLTVTLSGVGDALGLSPSFISHLVNELLFKTKLQGKLPNWVLDAFDISLLDPTHGFLNAGIGATIIKRKNFRWTLKASIGLNNSTHQEWSGSFRFEGSIGTGIAIKF